MSGRPYRLAIGGSRIDRTRKLAFSFDGRNLSGFAGDTVASAGSPIDLHRRDGKASEIIWDEHALVMLNLVDLGTSLSPTSNTSTNPTIVVTREFFAGFESNR